jgi:hypothetical protein
VRAAQAPQALAGSQEEEASRARRTRLASSFGRDFACVPAHTAGINQEAVADPRASLQRKRNEGAGGETFGVEERGGLPALLKAGVERLSGLSMDDVKVHRHSAEPARLRAHAFTHGTDIHIAPGQERHLPHEAWHVVQQKQGRVAPTHVLAHGAPLNDDAALEDEADRMGALASRENVLGHILNDNRLPAPAPVGRQALQLKTVPTAYGVFETIKFNEFYGGDSAGVEILLKFHPDEKKVDAKKIALVQSVEQSNERWAAFPNDPTETNRMVAPRRVGGGYVIDAPGTTNNPVYWNAKNLGPAEGLKGTPENANTNPREQPILGSNTNYELGHCYKESPTDVGKKKHPAGLWDQPTGDPAHATRKMFETTALAIEGRDENKYYGSVTWGYSMQEGGGGAPVVNKTDIEPASEGTPTANFMEAAKLWNEGRTRGTLLVTADPEATVIKEDGKTKDKLPKGTRLRQIERLFIDTDPAILAEVLDADGTPTNRWVHVKVWDVTDTGEGGTPNVPLPVE